jgi:hypothetical protein
VTSLADDLLRGARAIGEFINVDEKTVYYLAEKRLIPCGRQGRTLISSKRLLREHYDTLTSGAIEADPPPPRQRPAPQPASAHRVRRRPPSLRVNTAQKPQAPDNAASPAPPATPSPRGRRRARADEAAAAPLE